MNANKLYIKGVCYTVEPENNVADLPMDLNLSKIACKQSESAMVFFGRDHCFSNFYPVKTIIEDTEYSCTKQYIQRAKALLFDDNEASRAIMETKNPSSMKYHGSKVKNFEVFTTSNSSYATSEHWQ